jgi:hypothetical protein
VQVGSDKSTAREIAGIKLATPDVTAIEYSVFKINLCERFVFCDEPEKETICITYACLVGIKFLVRLDRSVAID